MIWFISEIVVKIELITFPEEDKEGFFEFRICAANDTTVTQKCLDDTQLPIKEGYMAGTPLRFRPGKAGDFHLTVALPPDLVCDRCVLQWRYRSGKFSQYYHNGYTAIENIKTTVLPANSDSDVVMFCSQSYQGRIIDTSLVY